LKIRVDYREKASGLVDLRKKEDVVVISRKTTPKSQKNGVHFSFEIHAFKMIYAIPKWNLRERRVFFISMVIVMGPTPPGTGVI